MNEEKIMCACDVCGKSFHFGHNRYDGHKNVTYNIMVCCECKRGNHDGWAPQFEEKVTKNLIQKRHPLPKRNAKGWLPYE